MKDIHNHLLYGIDDGSTSLEQSIKILNILEKGGVTDIVVTPHYIEGTNYNSNNKTKQSLLKKLQKHTKIKLYLGQESYIDNNLIELIQKDEISTINNTKYLLIEFPLTEKLEYANNIIFNLRDKGYIPIIAHPERYHYLNLEDFIYLKDIGCLLQGNITSLVGKYGTNAKKNLTLLLKKHMVDVLGTDNHGHYINIEECLDKLNKIIDINYQKEITDINFNKIINNEKITINKIVKTKNILGEKIR